MHIHGDAPNSYVNDYTISWINYVHGEDRTRSGNSI